MIYNYLKIAYRNLLRRKGFATINILGLSIGIAACILLFSVVSYELGYDTFQRNYENIYRVVTLEKSEEEEYTPGVPLPGVEAIRLRFPEATVAGIFASYGSQITVIGTDSTQMASSKKFIEDKGVLFAEPQALKIFDVKFLSGTADKLGEPGNVILSRAMATKYFGKWEDAYDKFIRLDLTVVLRVAGVIEDMPQQTDFPFQVLVPYKMLLTNSDKYNAFNDWNNNSSNGQIYMLLPKGMSQVKVDQGLLAMAKEVYTDNGTVTKKSHFLQPLRDLHFDTRFDTFGGHMISKPTIWTLVLVGIMIIIMACINFVNLATAQSISRSKEVGLRKVLGGNRGQLMGQFLGEAAIIVAFSLILGTILAKLLQPVLDSYLTINGTLELFTWRTLVFLLGLGVVVVLLSGFYPAMVLSGFQPVAALKSKVSNASLGKVSLRRGLVVLQFALSQLLIIGTLVAISQMNFIRDADLGLNKDAVLILSHNADSASISRLPSLKNDILGIAGVKSVSFTSDPPTSENNWTTNFAFDGRQDEKFPLAIKVADEDYFKTFGMEFIAGGPYRKSDTMTSFVINETLVRKLGLANAQEAIGRDMRTGGGKWMPITGVVRDFKTNSLRESVKPLAMFSRSRFFYVTGVKLSGKDFTQTVKQVQAVWDKHLPEYVNSSTFLDEDIADFYRQEDQLSKLYKMFSILAIIISCLGLYGLVSFMVLQKTKEVGVRKVLGASTSSIVFLFSKEFIMLIVVAFLIAAPMAWFGMNKWLENFVFRIKLGPGIFIAAVALTLLVAWITVGYKAIRAALMNPVKSLRTE